MATLVIRNVENSVHARLKARAAAHGHSMEEEARQLLRLSLAGDAPVPALGFGDAVRALFEPLGGVELPEIERSPLEDPIDFTGTEWDSDDDR